MKYFRSQFLGLAICYLPHVFSLEWLDNRALPIFPDVGTAIDAADITKLTGEEQGLLVTLQGIVNRENPRIYLYWNKADEDVKVDRVFVIGGATIYDAALKLPQTDRVLLTRIEREYECDTHFSVDLDKDQAWEKSGKEELEGFVGEEVDVVEEKGVKFEFGMYEKVKGGEGR